MSFTKAEYVDLIVGAPFIKTKLITNDYIEITYFNNFKEFKESKPKSAITEKDFNEYFYTGNKIEKILVTEPIRILRQFPDLSRVAITLMKHKFIADRKVLNSLFDFKIEELSTEDESWIQFVNFFTYNSINRPQLFKQIKNFSEGIIKLSQNHGVSVTEQIKWLNEKLSNENILIGTDGTYKLVERDLTKEEKAKNKVILYIFQGAVSALGARIMNGILDTDEAQFIIDYIASLLNY